MLFIFLYQLPDHQTFLIGFRPPAGFRPLTPDSELPPVPDFIQCWRWSYSFSYLFNQLFSALPKQSFLASLVRLLVWVVGCDPSALRWVARFVTIRSLSNGSLDLGRWFSMCSFLSVLLLNHSYWPQGTNSPRRNSFHSWITHLHPIIHQDPSAKPAGSSRVTSRPLTLSQVEVDVDVSRIRLCRARLAILSPLTRGLSWWLSGRAWVHSSRSTTTDLERRWSASSLLSMCSSISAWLLIETRRTFPRVASADWLSKLYPS